MSTIIHLYSTYINMEIELELLTSEKDEIQVMEKVLDLVRKAKELGFSIKELELETEEDEEDDEDDEDDEDEEETVE